MCPPVVSSEIFDMALERVSRVNFRFSVQVPLTLSLQEALV